MAMMHSPTPESGAVARPVLQKLRHTGDRGRAGSRIQRNLTVTLSTGELPGNLQTLAPRL